MKDETVRRATCGLVAMVVACGGSLTGINDDAGADATAPIDATTGNDSSTEADSSPCGTGEVLCGASCFPNDVNHCGPTCTQCGAPALGKATCNGTQCGFTCNDLQCGSTCVDPSTDNANCGACNRDCLGTNCVNGACAPQNLYSGEIADSIAVDAQNVYWVTETSFNLRMGPKAGGTATTVTTNVGYPLMSDTQSIYWVTPNAIDATPIDGGTTAQLPITLEYIGYLGTDAQNAYYSGAYGIGQTTLSKTPLDGGAPQVILAITNPRAVGGALGYAYFLNDQWELDRVSAETPDAAAEALFNVVSPHYLTTLTLDQAHVYLGTDSDVRMALLDGGANTSLVTGAPYLIAVDSTDIYWVDHSAGQTIYRTPIGGSTKTSMYTTATDSIGGIAVDATYIYWTLVSNTPSIAGIYRMVK